MERFEPRSIDTRMNALTIGLKAYLFDLWVRVRYLVEYVYIKADILMIGEGGVTIGVKNEIGLGEVNESELICTL